MKKNFSIESIKKVVVKIGTSALTDSEGSFSLADLKSVATQIHELLESGRDVIIVSSGAIGCGMKTLGLKRRPKELKTLQACAAIGQGKLMKAYEDLFSSFDRHTGQVLLTRDAFQDRVRCMNVRNTFHELLRLNVIPVVNENDTVSTEEIKFGDNDTLSVCVSELVDANLLILLSDADGLYINEETREIISCVENAEMVDDLFKHVFSQRKNVVTAGGMKTKLEAARRAMNSGISTVVMNGKKKGGISQLMNGESVGTLFFGSQSRRGFKTNWLTNLTQAHGNIRIDQGAYAALLKGGKSLLPSGVREVEGHFKAGDSVRISTEDGKTFARGIVNYSKDDLNKIKGRKTSEIVSILGSKREDEVIHRDNFVLVAEQK